LSDAKDQSVGGKIFNPTHKDEMSEQNA